MASLGTHAGTPRRGFLTAGVAALVTAIARKLDGQSIAPRNASSSVRIGRRVVTGVDSEGRSCVTSEQPVPPNAAWKTDTAEGLDFWVTQQLPAVLAGPLEPGTEYKRGNRAPAGGVVGRLITWAPGFQYPRHTTPTLDYIIVIAGQLELILDTESRVLGPGDVAIQRGTAHAWRVVGSDACTFAGIMLDAASQG